MIRDLPAELLSILEENGFREVSAGEWENSTMKIILLERTVVDIEVLVSRRERGVVTTWTESAGSYELNLDNDRERLVQRLRMLFAEG